MRKTGYGTVGLLLWVTLCLCAEPATRPTTEPPADETPLQMMKRSCKVYDSLDLNAMMALTQTNNEKERELNKTYCQYARELGRVEQAVEKKFGRKAADDIVHAVDEKTESDVDHAKCEMDGDTAKIIFEGDPEPYRLRRVNGVWKGDLARVLQDQTEAQKQETQKLVEGWTVEMPKVLKRIESGELSTAEQVVEAMKKLVAPPPAPEPGKGGL